MLLRLFPSIARPFFSLSSRSRLYCASREMGQDSSECEVIQVKRRASFRLCNVSSYTTEILEIRADDPTLHVVVIPGNPGVVLFYKEFLESLYELLGGTASVTAVGHISQTKKSWEHGRLFSLQEQINHKMDVIKQELQNNEVPILLVGHSIGSYISVEMFKRSPEKVKYCIGLYPFLALNPQSRKQSIIGKIAESRILCVVFSFIVALLGLLPIRLLRLIVTMFLGKWSATAVDAVCSHLVKYHTMRNVLFLAMTEFRKLSETPDWAFMRANQHKIAFLFAIDDHWGPLQMFEEISKQVPDAALSIDREGLTDHGFCCTEAGSSWVAEHVTKLIKNQKASE
ncbi:lipid droplet-associated hydrolase isoform X2 [Prunus yedoensis var. nudiflora]|uniref:Lipid droplet-associated hydrolase isoform X2 n=1 Tax=Prunus yedoensis var. nudiflora TaxID=2094558 RepID=A0A314Y4U2_PRUYE|nr:lipid droplet-associated hydrolase isoform X2 [Prunus yedoensis var. nudiflora]